MLKYICDYDRSRLHDVRDILEAIHNGLSVDYAEDTYIKLALSSIEEALSVKQRLMNRTARINERKI
ncbi:hypothetical protein PCURB6_27050 [Paenibacillus curdlanolyticus]|nr:hypothetical protein PCURB6_27050 [Paenibacillus curdlanolyticus]